jgi:glycosyltransferase involved in cell wall biosynthesis
VASLVAGLVRHGHTVTVHGPAATERQFGFAGLGARFTPVEIPASPGPTDLSAVLTLRRALRSIGRPDVIHAHSLRAGFVTTLARPAGPPLVVTWHNLVLGSGLRGRIYHHLERRVARAADITLCASADLVDRARALGARDARLAIVAAPPLPNPTCSPTDVREQLGLRPSQPLVLSVGRLHPQKGYDTLIAAAAHWRREPRPFVAIAGSGPAHAVLAEKIAGAAAPVTLLGSRDDIADLLAAADVAVVSSLWEGQPLFVQEVLRAGVPLVATAVGGIPKVVGDAAILVPPHDANALSRSVGRLLDDPNLRAEYARLGPIQAATWPDETAAIDQVASTYAELCNGATQSSHRQTHHTKPIGRPADPRP